MNKLCAVPRCSGEAVGYSTHCDTHKKALRRHGHAQQAGVTVHQLGPYLQRVQARREKNPASDLWAILEARWLALSGNAGAINAKWAGGASMVGAEVEVAVQMLKLAVAVPAADVINAVLAMYLLRDAEPRRFQSDRAFMFQMARRVRGLTSLNAGSYWDNAKKKSRRVYQDLTPNVAELLASTLAFTFGAVGLTLAAKEREDANQAQADTQRLATALEALT